MKNTKKIYCEISAGELFDKISILEIKNKNIKDRYKKLIITRELSSLKKTSVNNFKLTSSLKKYYQKLKSINLKLWKIEDEIRDHERNKQFNNKFIKLARAVYFTNDLRSQIKNKINTLTKSGISEVKSYKKY